MKKGLRIVVTGGAGLIGSWVVEYLLKEFGKELDKILIFDNFVRGTRENLKEVSELKKIEIVEGDVRDRKSVDRSIRGADYVIHEAAIRITQCEQDPRLCNEVLVDGTFNVFEACVKHNVKKLIFNSSASVYGQPLKLPMGEDDPYNNDTAYGAAKIASEQMAKAFRKMFGLNYVCLRPFNVYGPRMDIYGVYTEVLIKWLDRIDQNLPPIIHGDGKQSLDFIYIEDVAQATICALKASVNEGFYNVGTGRQTDLNTLAQLLLRLTGSRLQPAYEPQKSTVHVTRRKADIERSKKDLGFVSRTTLEEGLRKLIAWRREARYLRFKKEFDRMHGVVARLRTPEEVEEFFETFLPLGEHEGLATKVANDKVKGSARNRRARSRRRNGPAAIKTG